MSEISLLGLLETFHARKLQLLRKSSVRTNIFEVIIDGRVPVYFLFSSSYISNLNCQPSSQTNIVPTGMSAMLNFESEHMF